MDRAFRLNCLTGIASALATVLVLASPAHAEDAGFGSDIPLGIAAKQIVPADYKVQMGDGVNEGALSSWSNGGDGWRKAIATAASSAGYVATVSDKTVRISRAGAVVERVKDEPVAKDRTDRPVRAASADDRPRRARPERVERRERRHVERRVVEKRVVEEETVSGGGFVLVGPRKEETVKVAARGDWKDYDGEKTAAAPAAAASWVVGGGDDLHRVLLDWAGREGWRLVWKSDYDYRLSSAAKFDGSFVEATTELMRSLKDARPVITAKFFEGNKTLVVGNGSLDEAN